MWKFILIWHYKQYTQGKRVNWFLLFVDECSYGACCKIVNMWWHRTADDRRRVLLCLCILLAFCCIAETQSSYRRKFEYKLSFKGPHLVQTDGTIPFWEHFGSMLVFLIMPYVYVQGTTGVSWAQYCTYKVELILIDYGLLIAFELSDIDHNLHNCLILYFLSE